MKGIARRLLGDPRREAERALSAIGALHARHVRGAHFDDPREAEFRVFSQFGEDGILQYLIAQVPIENEVFVEFGVQDYRESNTRFLVEHDNWRGLIMDAGSEHIGFLASDPFGWRHDVLGIEAFITRDNINQLIAGAGIGGDIGLLSVDLDGNDYWVLDAIDVVSPRIMVCEYNSIFGPTEAVTVPYDAAFERGRAHYSHLYWGASIAALHEVAVRKGFTLVAGNSAGNNVFFVRSDVAGELRSQSPEQAWAASRYRDSRDEEGHLSFVASHRDRLRLIADMPLVDVRSGEQRTVREAVAL